VLAVLLGVAGCQEGMADVPDSARSNDAAPGDDSGGGGHRDSGGGDVPPPDSTAPAGSMRLISRTAPIYGSNGPTAFRGPDLARDGVPNTGWSPTSLPGWLAYDLSATPVAQRQQGVVVWNGVHSYGYLSTSGSPPGDALPVDYTIEVNMAPGGGQPPTDGWSRVAGVQGNTLGSGQHVVQMGGANWIRLAITRSSDSSGGLEIDFDVYSAPNGATDSWLFMGDSITHITFPYAICDVPHRVNAINPDRWPAVIEAGIGGSGAGSTVGIIDDTIRVFPGRYVVLAYGTNDHANEFPASMETLVQHVLAAGKIPVIPHIPWSSASNIQTDGPPENAAIDALYARYPQIVRGPDLWTVFMNRTDLIAPGDVHPNTMGQAELRAQWARVIAAIP
jgi:hypothetical protein